jgi:hypothetical protein
MLLCWLTIRSVVGLNIFVHNINFNIAVVVKRLHVEQTKHNEVVDYINHCTRRYAFLCVNHIVNPSFMVNCYFPLVIRG